MYMFMDAGASTSWDGQPVFAKSDPTTNVILLPGISHPDQSSECPLSIHRLQAFGRIPLPDVGKISRRPGWEQLMSRRLLKNNLLPMFSITAFVVKLNSHLRSIFECLWTLPSPHCPVEKALNSKANIMDQAR